MPDIVTSIMVQSWRVLGEMAPYLLLGFFVAGLLSLVFSEDWVRRHLGRGGWGPIIRASLVGIPLPLCSCGVLPVGASLRKHGAGKGAVTAFLLSTPQTGVDSIAVTYILLGPVFAVIRPLAALVTGLLGGGLVHALDARESAGPEEKHEACTDSCCTRAGSRLMRALHHGFVVLPRDIGPSLIAGVLLSGALAVLLGEDRLAAWVGGGAGSILLMMLAGVPLYVCATASVPIAAGLIYVGVSPGAAMAFLIAGPATNAAAFATIHKILGRRSAGIYLATVAVSAFAGGLLVDALLPGLGADIRGLVARHARGPSWYSSVFAVALLLLLACSHLRGVAGAGKHAPAPAAGDATAAAPSCSHCAGAAPDRTAAPGATEACTQDQTCAILAAQKPNCRHEDHA